MSHYDIAVVGLGAMGSATLYQSARRGADVVGIDRFDPPHIYGSSHGETRITRQAVGEGEVYAPLAIRSHEIWRRLEAATGESLFIECGTLVMASASQPNSHHGKGDFLAKTVRAAENYDIEHEVLDAEQIQTRFPQYQNLRDDEVACFEPGGGYLLPARCIATQLQAAGHYGADVIRNTSVRAISDEGDHVRVATSTGAITAKRAVAAVGAWTGPLLGPPFDRLLTVNRQTLHWFEMKAGAAWPCRWPVAIWLHGPTDTDYFYSFPPQPNATSVKVATEQYCRATTADGVPRNVTADESMTMFDQHVAGRIAGVTSRPVRTAACVYTVTPDRGFVFDWHPDNDKLLVISACSGHGFKHSAGIGDRIAASLIEGDDSIDRSAFQLARFS